MAKAAGADGYPVVKLASSDGQIVTIQFSDDKECGRGSFGVVFPAIIVETGERVAIKRVLQDDRYINRELQIMKSLFHPNVVKLKRYWEEPAQGGSQLSLVMEFIPDTVGKVIKYYDQKKTIAPSIVTKLYVYQMCRGLAYVHAKGICHRDIKPQNLLCNSKTHVLKVCDFGSAKDLVPGKPSIAYICSRYYRAPELIFGATHYTFAIDVWSAGCVFAEMMLGVPAFAGATSVDQKIEIIRILGTPSRAQLRAMNPELTHADMPAVSKVPWSSIFKSRASPEAIDLLEQMLNYNPSERVTAINVLAHPYFDELRHPATRLPNGEELPALFNMTSDELQYIPVETLEKIIPAHARNPSNWPSRIAAAVASKASAADIGEKSPLREEPSAPLAAPVTNHVDHMERANPAEARTGPASMATENAQELPAAGAGMETEVDSGDHDPEPTPLAPPEVGHVAVEAPVVGVTTSTGTAPSAGSAQKAGASPGLASRTFGLLSSLTSRGGTTAPTQKVKPEETGKRTMGSTVGYSARSTGDAASKPGSNLSTMSNKVVSPKTTSVKR